MKMEFCIKKCIPNVFAEFPSLANYLVALWQAVETYDLHMSFCHFWSQSSMFLVYTAKRIKDIEISYDKQEHKGNKGVSCRVN